MYPFMYQLCPRQTRDSIFGALLLYRDWLTAATTILNICCSHPIHALNLQRKSFRKVYSYFIRFLYFPYRAYLYLSLRFDQHSLGDAPSRFTPFPPKPTSPQDALFVLILLCTLVGPENDVRKISCSIHLGQRIYPSFARGYIIYHTHHISYIILGGCIGKLCCEFRLLLLEHKHEQADEFVCAFLTMTYNEV